MSCQCYQIGGPFISEDPDCLVHGADARRREREIDALVEKAQTETDVEKLRAIIADIADVAKIF